MAARTSDQIADQETAERLQADTRRRFLECRCDTETLVCTAHFPSPSVGRVGRWGDGGFRFTPRGDG